MPKYYANSPDSINEIFDREGEELQREGFHYPDMTTTPDGFKELDTSPKGDNGSVNVLPSPVEEAAKLGIDLETYLQG